MRKYGKMQKYTALETALRALDSKQETIKNNRCMEPPIGCGREIDPSVRKLLFDDQPELSDDIADEVVQHGLPFRDYLSLKEYHLSGLCQECQFRVFDSSGDHD